VAGFMMRDYPLSGVGVGGYIIESSNYGWIHKTSVWNPQSAENYILQVGSEFGLVGIFLILWIFWEIIKKMRQSHLNISNTERKKYILFGAISGVISYLVNIQVHSFIGSYEIKYTFWFLVALIICLGRKGKKIEEKFSLSKSFKIVSVISIILFGTVHLWNSTHSLSLKQRTKQLRLKQDFGFYPQERTNVGENFRWTKSYGGITVTLKEPVIDIPLYASHPDIRINPVKVKIYVLKDFFNEKRLLDEIVLTRSVWKNYEFHLPEEINEEVILLFKVSRTWNPLKSDGTPDPRNLGIAIGEIQFRKQTR
jgi:hypothetical protein